MNIQRLLMANLVLLAFSALAQADVFGYKLDVTTQYGFSLPGGTVTPFGGPSPDTGFWTVFNAGATTFTGTVGQVALAGNGLNFDFTTGTITLAPGQSISVAVNSESSNQGGYGGATGTLQNGVDIQLIGNVNGTEAVNLSVFDKDIHSGIFRSADGHSSDSYVLQGGDPFGGDTGDAFEVSQAFGHFEFFEAAAAVPEPGAFVLLGTVLAILGIGKKLFRKTA
jgi:hypothetical protein